MKYGIVVVLWRWDGQRLWVGISRVQRVRRVRVQCGLWTKLAKGWGACAGKQGAGKKGWGGTAVCNDIVGDDLWCQGVCVSVWSVGSSVWFLSRARILGEEWKELERNLRVEWGQDAAPACCSSRCIPYLYHRLYDWLYRCTAVPLYLCTVPAYRRTVGPLTASLGPPGRGRGPLVNVGKTKD